MIEKYLKKLLVAQDEVYAEGIGTFKAEHETAKVTEEGSLVPPRRFLSFHKDAGGDTGVLLRAIAEGEQISENEAGEALQSFAADFSEKMTQNSRFEIPGIGYLENADGEIVFTPNASDEADFSPAEYGLPAVDLIEPTPKIVAEPATGIDEPIAKASPAAEISKPEAAEQTSKTVNKKVKVEDKKKNSELVLWTVAVVVLFILAFATYLLLNKEAMSGFKAFFKPETEIQKVEETPISEELTVDTTTTAQEEFEAEEFGSEATDGEGTTTTEETSEQPVVEETTNTPTDNTYSSGGSSGIAGNFYIIAGSYSHKNIAEKMLSEITAKGLTARLIYSPKQNMHRLALEEFSDLATAEARKNELSSQFESLWVLKY